MCIWRNRIVVLYPGKIVVFGNLAGSDQLGDETLSSSQCIRVHYLQAAFDEFFVLNYDNYPDANGCQDALRLILREGSGFVRSLLIRYDEGSDTPGNLVFATTWSRLELPCMENDRNTEAAKVVVGPTCGRILTLTNITHPSWPMPTLYVSQVTPTQESIAFGPCIPLSTKGMPLLFDVTSLDFDDGIGLIVIGRLSGEVCVRTFGATLPSSSLATDLPSLHASPDFKVSESSVFTIFF